MITPFTRHFIGLPVPVLVSVMRDLRKVTLRTFREVPGATVLADGRRTAKAKELSARLAAHGGAGRDHVFRAKLIEGARLDPRFEGRAFELLGSAGLDLDGGLGGGEWTDYGNWVFPLDREGVPGVPFNRYIDTVGSKARTPRLLALKGINCALQIYAPFATCDFSNCSFSVALHPDFGMIGNLDPGNEVTMAEVLKGASQAFPRLTISGPQEVTADGAAELTLALKTSRGTLIRDASPQVYLEETAGYLPKRRLVPQDGKAVFTVMALGLKVGDSIRVKAGFRHFGGLADYLLAVV